MTRASSASCMKIHGSVSSGSTMVSPGPITASGVVRNMVSGRASRPASRTVRVPRPRRCHMTTGVRCLPRLFTVGAFALLVASVVVAAGSTALQAAETPRRGGVLLAVIGADPPSLDPHQESTFANIELVAPVYSTLLQLDPYSYPKVIGDVATEWKVAPDGLTYTFKLRQGIRFHDGTT